jgi:hypothetical protein
MNYRVYWIRLKSMINPYIEGYVGITKFDIKKRLSQHISTPANVYLANALKKYSVDIEIVLIKEVFSLEEAKHVELHYRPNENIGWNLAKGGWVPPSRKNIKSSDKTLEKLRVSHLGQIAWNKGITSSDETKTKLSIARKNRKINDETRNKTSKTMKRLGIKPPVLRGESNGFFGKTHSEETKYKMRLAWAKRKGISI